MTKYFCVFLAFLRKKQYFCTIYVLMNPSVTSTPSHRCEPLTFSFRGKSKNLFGKPVADEAVADLTAYQVEMFSCEMI